MVLGYLDQLLRQVPVTLTCLSFLPFKDPRDYVGPTWIAWVISPSQHP